MGIIEFLKKLKNTMLITERQEVHFDEHKMMLSKLLVDHVKVKKEISSLQEVEFKVFSQWGDDGIIQWLIHNLDIPNKTFIEFGVEYYVEANTRFLLMNDNWSGLVMDGSKDNIDRIRQSDFYWKYDLTAKEAFIDCDNINGLISEQRFDRELGILHIDIDGNDYWIWENIDVVNPVIVIMEYNSVFGKDRAITVPYNKTFYRTDAHHSNLYFGASLKAFCHLAEKKGYALVGSNSAGNNAYFVRKDKLNEEVKEVSLDQGYVYSKVREGRDDKGNLNYVSGNGRLDLIKGLPVINVETGEQEEI